MRWTMRGRTLMTAGHAAALLTLPAVQACLLPMIRVPLVRSARMAGQATAQAPTPHTSWSAEGDRRRLHHEQQMTVLFRSAMAVLTIISGVGVCDAGVTRELARTCGPAIACGISPIALREYRESPRLAASSTALANQARQLLD